MSQGSPRCSGIAPEKCPHGSPAFPARVWGHSCSRCPDFVFPAYAQFTAMQLQFSLSSPELFTTWGWDRRIQADEALSTYRESLGCGLSLIESAPGRATEGMEPSVCPVERGQGAVALDLDSRAVGPVAVAVPKATALESGVTVFVHSSSQKGAVPSEASVACELQPYGDTASDGCPCRLSPAASVTSALRSASVVPPRTHEDSGRKVRFCPEIAFWFALEAQTTLPPASQHRLLTFPGGSCPGNLLLPSILHQRLDLLPLLWHLQAVPVDPGCLPS